LRSLRVLAKRGRAKVWCRDSRLGLHDQSRSPAGHSPQARFGVADDAASRSLVRSVRYFNREYRRSGTLWEGRYKSCFVQDDHYLLMCYRYVELNPVRAAMVDDPPDYRWSSYHANTLGKAAVMRTPHSEYLRLGGTKVERQVANRGLFRYQVDAPLLTEVRLALNQGLVLGNERFKDEVESMLGKRMRPARVGRPRRDRESSADGGAGKQSKTLF